MAKVADFLDYVSLHAADADEDILRFYIQEAVTDFLIDTKLAVDYHRFSMIDKVHDYVLDPPECHTIISIKSVRVGQRCEEVVDWRDLKETARREHWGYYTDIDNEGEPSIWIGEPCELSDIEVEYVYTLGRGACEIPNFVYTKYARAVQYYALSKIYAVPGQEWSNLQVAMNYLKLYEMEVAKIKRATRKVKGGKLTSKAFIGGGKCFGCGGFFR